MKKKNIILASVIVLFIFIVTVIIWFNANSANVNTKSAEESVSDAQNLQEGSTAPAEAGDNGAAEEGEVKKKEVKVLSAEEIEEENLKAMAANFVERWGSWSTDGDYSNFNSLKVQMTEEMRKFNEENKLEIRNLKLEIRKWKLVLVGVRNYFYERLEEYVKDNFPDIKDRIIFLGYATDKELAQLYKNAALYVFPSLEEGFGLPPLEAMSYGVPVISSDKSCLSEILSNAVLYFDAENSEDMADKILCGLEDEKRRKDLIKKGYERIQLYDWEKNARKTMEVYGEV